MKKCHFDPFTRHLLANTKSRICENSKMTILSGCFFFLPMQLRTSSTFPLTLLVVSWCSPLHRRQTSVWWELPAGDGAVSGTFPNCSRLLLAHLVRWFNARLNSRFYPIVQRMSPIHQKSSLRWISWQQHGTNLLCAASAEIGLKLGGAGRQSSHLLQHLFIFNSIFSSLLFYSCILSLFSCVTNRTGISGWSSLCSAGALPPHALAWEPQ